MSTASEAHSDNPVHRNLLVPLKFESKLTFPETHAWSQDSIPVVEQQESIPVIDFSSPDAGKLIKHACETWGLFYITNHGICPSLVENALVENHRFFTLPSEQKMKAFRSTGKSTGYGVVRMTPFFEKLMWMEGFTVIGSSCEDDAKKIWPDAYQQFSETMNMYQKEIKALCDQILFKMLESLDISEDDINTANLNQIWNTPTIAMQLNSYPPCPKPDAAMGLAPHTDTYMITVLNQNNTSGFQAFREGYGWVTINPIKDALVVNVGDILHILSNAKFHSLLHRVMVDEAAHRVAIAYFYGPPMDFQITPLAKLVEEGKKPHYRSLSVKEYSILKAQNLAKALPLIRNV